MTKPVLPQGGGSWTRDDKGELKQVQAPTKPAEKAKPAPKAPAKKKEG
ncbi:hypothetical protein [Tropicibacter sp. S64]